MRTASLASFAAALVTGCASSAPPDPSVTTFTSPAQLATPAAATAPLALEERRLVVGDTVDIVVFQVPDLSRTAEIDAAGEINMPLIGRVAVTGKTTRELETQLAQLFAGRYLRNPQITVTLKTAATPMRLPLVAAPWWRRRR